MRSEPIRKQRARKRLHDLIVQYALQTITEKDEAKMRRYQALFRYKPRPNERHSLEVLEHNTRIQMKHLGAFIFTKTPEYFQNR